MNTNQTSQNMKKTKQSTEHSNVGTASELTQPKNKANDDQSEAPKVDPGIDYMRWSD